MDEFQMHYAKWSKPDSEDFVMLLIWNPQKERATGAENRWAAASRGRGGGYLDGGGQWDPMSWLWW